MILVFGKTGQVATELQACKKIKALGRGEADLSNPQSCVEAIKFFEPKAVINAAAYTAVDKAESEEALVNIINCIAPGAMANACAELDIPFLQLSTDYVFFGEGETPFRNIDTPNPKNTYGKSKLKGEEAVRASGCTYAILRVSWLISAHGNNFVKTMLRLSESNEVLKIVDDQVGGPTCARDLAQACISIVGQLIEDPAKSGIYHYSGQPYVSWCQFANFIFQLADRRTVAMPILTSNYETTALRPLNSRLDCSLTENIFGLPRPNWQDGLKEILKELEVGHDKA